MYAGITSLQSENGDVILGMNSREGEGVPFENHIKISDNSTINIWLGKVDEQMSFSLATSLEHTMKEVVALEKHDESVLSIINKYPAQVVLLALQILWCNKVEAALNDTKGSPAQQLEPVEVYIVAFLAMLAENVMKDVKKDLRQKFEQIITDFVHQRDVTRTLMKSNITSSKDFAWQYFMRFSWVVKESNVLKKLVIQMSNASFHYGFEYLGIGEKLVQTPLTDKCYLTLTQALHLRMGGNPFGPAGTGKTESVKALGAQLGRFVLVFNCDETFDFNAMGRIFIGLCQVGAWGCFDEFNRLEERMLSAVSQQILTIQTGLREKLTKIDLLGREVLK
jgi:dynein heavy chain 1, cytosolic